MKYLKSCDERVIQATSSTSINGSSRINTRCQITRLPHTEVMINAWAIGREAATWGPGADEFRPERHLDSSLDFRGQNFELIPFGAGRRICPAISFVVVLNEVVLANLVHQFDWRIPVESIEDQTSVAESTGSVIHRKFPLYAIASLN
ncbi:unnamed protein product [Arabis nemorensis]|uniref:Cytochrome P450 n=1 Tax=Arabis nemorensis TaxID=586526 RepID=A0A565BTQ3_9BRAS|nr:unnamed protein product [Arabis nemorensis]